VPDLYAFALACARRGWHVFPLVPGEKIPAVKAWPQRATTAPDQLTAWWHHRPFNPGIATGPSGLVVVDLDVPKPDDIPPEAWRLPGVTCGADVLAVLAERHHQPYPADTFTVTTPSGGTHLYFTHPAGGPELHNTKSFLGWRVDTRAHGGMVVAPGSTTPTGAYHVTSRAPVAPLPAWLARLLTPKPSPAVVVAAPRLATGRVYVDAAVANECAAVRQAQPGTRNEVLVRAARALSRFITNGELTHDQVEQALNRPAMAAGLSEREALKAIRAAIRWAITHDRRAA
jgi:hypothetical protein